MDMLKINLYASWDMHCWGNVNLNVEKDWSFPSELLCSPTLSGQTGPNRHAQITVLDQPL